jgi:nucleotide-binding universal stress UspA family protein
MSELEPGRVAVGVAGDQPAVLDYARREAERAGCGMTLVHAYTVPPSAMGSMYGLDIPESFKAGGQAVLDEAVRQLSKEGAPDELDCVLTRGFAPAVLESQSRDARVMVIGPDEPKPWYIRLFEGSVARHLVEHAACPVVVVPAKWASSGESGPVVVMVDSVATSHGPLAYAFEAASTRHTELQVLHVLASQDEATDDEWTSIRRVVDAWFARYPIVRGATRAVTGDLREGALGATYDAALLVVGQPDERHAPGFLVDSLARDIITSSDCPVAVVPVGYRG